MKVRQTDVSLSDRHSAEEFFRALNEHWDLAEADVLDAFARNGQLTVRAYHKYLYDPSSQLDLWELGPEHRGALDEFSPREVRIGCSYESLNLCRRAYDLVVVDTPQGLHMSGDGVTTAEHFDFLGMLMRGAPQKRVPATTRVLKDRSVVAVYVNKSPYDKDETGSHGYDEYQEYDFGLWTRWREQFYRTNGPAVTEERALSAYRRLAGEHGYRIAQTLSVPCHSDVPGREPYAYRLAMELVRE